MSNNSTNKKFLSTIAFFLALCSYHEAQAGGDPISTTQSASLAAATSVVKDGNDTEGDDQDKLDDEADDENAVSRTLNGPDGYNSSVPTETYSLATNTSTSPVCDPCAVNSTGKEVDLGGAAQEYIAGFPAVNVQTAGNESNNKPKSNFEKWTDRAWSYIPGAKKPGATNKPGVTKIDNGPVVPPSLPTGSEFSAVNNSPVPGILNTQNVNPDSTFIGPMPDPSVTVAPTSPVQDMTTSANPYPTSPARPEDITSSIYEPYKIGPSGIASYNHGIGNSVPTMTDAATIAKVNALANDATISSKFPHAAQRKDEIYNFLMLENPDSRLPQQEVVKLFEEYSKNIKPAPMNWGEWISNTGSAIKNAPSNAATWVYDTGASTVSAIKNAPSNAYNWVTTSSPYQTAKGYGESALNGAKDTAAGSAIINAPSNAYNWVTTSSPYQTAKGYGESALNGAKDAAYYVGTNGINLGLDTISGAKDVTRDVINYANERGPSGVAHDGIALASVVGSVGYDAAATGGKYVYDKGKDGVNYAWERGARGVAQDGWNATATGGKYVYEKGKDGVNYAWERGARGVAQDGWNAAATSGKYVYEKGKDGFYYIKDSGVRGIAKDIANTAYNLLPNKIKDHFAKPQVVSTTNSPVPQATVSPSVSNPIIDVAKLPDFDNPVVFNPKTNGVEIMLDAPVAVINEQGVANTDFKNFYVNAEQQAIAHAIEAKAAIAPARNAQRMASHSISNKALNAFGGMGYGTSYSRGGYGVSYSRSAPFMKSANNDYANEQSAVFNMYNRALEE